jgi:hypothetical protein
MSKRTQRLSSGLALGVREHQVPTGAVRRIGIAKLCHKTSQPRGFTFVPARRRIEDRLDLRLAGDADNAPNACHTQEQPITLDILPRPDVCQVDKHIRAKVANSHRQAQKFQRVSRACSVPHVAIDQPGVAQHSRR